uniref:ATP synthase complex subunit 8 n=1 Tax=Neoceratodus forsteri TaxID=7892 RepID=A0A343KRJ8_NEOFS|nr:ATP synthase F0 subunit 8 [Neoceratodus forsteri]
MPQLNPNPWFMILLLSWIVFLLILPSKIIAHTYLNEPTTQNTEKLTAQPWTWPWT